MRSCFQRAFAFGLLALMVPAAGLHAELRGDHDAFFDGLLQLDAARQVLQHAPPGSAAEQGRLHIEKAMDAFRSSCAAIDDRRLSPRAMSTQITPGASSQPTLAALALLRQARRRIQSVPFDPLTAGPQYRSVLQIDQATRALSGT
jgi:hypothetical protein